MQKRLPVKVVKNSLLLADYDKPIPIPMIVSIENMPSRYARQGQQANDTDITRIGLMFGQTINTECLFKDVLYAINHN